jgi:hypothetical protein
MEMTAPNDTGSLPTPEAAKAQYDAGEISYADLVYANASWSHAMGHTNDVPRKATLSDYPIASVPATQGSASQNPFVPRNNQLVGAPWQPFWSTDVGQPVVVFPWVPGGGAAQLRPGELWPDGSGKVIPQPTDDQLRALGIRARAVPEAAAPEVGDTARPHQLLQFFAYSHLPSQLANVSAPFRQLAADLDRTLPENPEKTTALRKLLESKDCAVRAVLYKESQP